MTRYHLIRWQDVLSRNGMPWKDNGYEIEESFEGLQTLDDLKDFLDAVHIRFCLVRPYQTSGNYPLVEARELLPSFDNAMFEYKNLPGFSMVALDRSLSYFRERFQYDILYPSETDEKACVLQKQIHSHNMQAYLSRLPSMHKDVFRQQFARVDLADITSYPQLTPYLVNMDRAHVLSRNPAGHFAISGIYASFTNDIDSVLKRFGLSIGKFARNDNELYARNRLFVYQYLMELYGFPIVSERRTSAAMFARRLNNSGERFLLKVLGQTDRTITTYMGTGTGHRFPHLEKTALVAVEPDQEDAIEAIAREGFFLDQQHRVVILRVKYAQHRYDPGNIRQDRALSVSGQEIIHPLTGRVLKGINIIRDATNMYLRLNDIVRGEYTGQVIYKRNDIILSTERHEDRLKVLYYWLSKNQRRIIDYSDDFFQKVCKILTDYLFAPKHDDVFSGLRELHLEVCSRLGYIQQARRVRLLEELRQRTYKGERISYRRMIQLALEVVKELKFEVVNFFPEIVENVIACLEHITSDRYLIRNYIQHHDKPLTEARMEIRKGYGALVSATDDFRKVLRSRTAWQPQQAVARMKKGAETKSRGTAKSEAKGQKTDAGAAAQSKTDRTPECVAAADSAAAPGTDKAVQPSDKENDPDTAS